MPENHTIELIVAHRKAQNQKVVGNFRADGRVTLLPLTPGRPSNTRKKVFPELVREYCIKCKKVVFEPFIHVER